MERSTRTLSGAPSRRAEEREERGDDNVAYLHALGLSGPDVGLALVVIGACLSLASLLSLGRGFGVRPALYSSAK